MGQHPASSRSYPHYKPITEHESHPTDLTKYDWYHSNITQEQVERALKLSSPNNPFLVKKSGHTLVLSKRINGWNSHDTIHSSTEGYYLEGKDKVFKSVPEMISHYQRHPIKKGQVLGKGIGNIPGTTSHS